MDMNRRTIFISVAICAVIILGLRSLLMIELRRLGKEVSVGLKEELYKDFIDTFVNEIDGIIEKIEKKTIPTLKNHERLNSSREGDQWTKGSKGDHAATKYSDY